MLVWEMRGLRSERISAASTGEAVTMRRAVSAATANPHFSWLGKERIPVVLVLDAGARSARRKSIKSVSLIRESSLCCPWAGIAIIMHSIAANAIRNPDQEFIVFPQNESDSLKYKATAVVEQRQ
jgi:hypothetical protein